MKKILLVLSFIFLLSGCSNNSVIPTQKSNLTVGMIKSKVVKGQTTQNEILSLFGAPNLITKNKKSNEVWGYNKMSVQASSSSSSSWFLLSSSASAQGAATTNTFDFIVTFDSNDIVLDYSMISSSY